MLVLLLFGLIRFVLLNVWPRHSLVLPMLNVRLTQLGVLLLQRELLSGDRFELFHLFLVLWILLLEGRQRFVHFLNEITERLFYKFVAVRHLFQFWLNLDDV